MEITYRQVSPADVPFLLALRKATMETHLKAEGIFLTTAEHLARVEYQLAAARVILYGGLAIGLLKLTLEEEEYEIVQFQILADYQGKGIGRRVLLELLQAAEEEGRPIKLSVLKRNPAAGLYLKMGFKTVGETEDSLLMRMQNSKAKK